MSDSPCPVCCSFLTFFLPRCHGFCVPTGEILGRAFTLAGAEPMVECSAPFFHADGTRIVWITHSGSYDPGTITNHESIRIVSP